VQIEDSGWEVGSVEWSQVDDQVRAEAEFQALDPISNGLNQIPFESLCEAVLEAAPKQFDEETAKSVDQVSITITSVAGSVLLNEFPVGVTSDNCVGPVGLPSGQVASLYDVVLEEAEAAMAPDAFTDPEQIEEGDIPEDIALDEEPDGLEAPAGDAATGGLARFRLLVPGLGGEGAGFEAVAGDFLWLCEQVALPALAANGWTPTEVVVALSDREVEFGATDPEAVQFFEGFRIADGACVPQAF
jgi:hypothetical protein